MMLSGHIDTDQFYFNFHIVSLVETLSIGQPPQPPQLTEAQLKDWKCKLHKLCCY